MKPHKVKITADARDDLKRYLGYIRNRLKNPPAARALADDFRNTKNVLADVADSIADSESEKLKDLRLKRLNFLRHDYFLLFRVTEDVVEITNIFHMLEDYEDKLK